LHGLMLAAAPGLCSISKILRRTCWQGFLGYLVEISSCISAPHPVEMLVPPRRSPVRLRRHEAAVVSTKANQSKKTLEESNRNSRQELDKVSQGTYGNVP